MTIAIILAGGTGSRIKSDIPKQFIELSGQMSVFNAMKDLQGDIGLILQKW